VAPNTQLHTLNSLCHVPIIRAKSSRLFTG